MNSVTRILTFILSIRFSAKLLLERDRLLAYVLSTLRKMQTSGRHAPSKVLHKHSCGCLCVCARARVRFSRARAFHPSLQFHRLLCLLIYSSVSRVSKQVLGQRDVFVSMFTRIHRNTTGLPYWCRCCKHGKSGYMQTCNLSCLRAYFYILQHSTAAPAAAAGTPSATCFLFDCCYIPLLRRWPSR